MNESIYDNDDYLIKETPSLEYWLQVTFFSIYGICWLKIFLYYSKKNYDELGYALGIEPHCEESEKEKEE